MGVSITRKEADRLGLGHLWPGRRVRTRTRRRGMTVTERRYADLLEVRRLLGEVTRWEYEPEVLTLAPSCTYRPDFRVTLNDGSVEYHEVKAVFFREDGLIKLKWAASAYPDRRFYLCRWRRGRWEVRRVSGGS